jgi:hypothetical protein
MRSTHPIEGFKLHDITADLFISGNAVFKVLDSYRTL